jgi:hypothetical protein
MVLRVKVSPGLIGGDVDEGYGKLADVFRRAMTGGQEIRANANVAVFRDGVTARRSSTCGAATATASANHPGR